MSGNTPGIITSYLNTARLLATEVLLADPEALGDDVLESCLYLLRDRLRGKDSETSDPADSRLRSQERAMLSAHFTGPQRPARTTVGRPKTGGLVEVARQRQDGAPERRVTAGARRRLIARKVLLSRMIYPAIIGISSRQRKIIRVYGRAMPLS